MNQTLSMSQVEDMLKTCVLSSEAFPRDPGSSGIISFPGSHALINQQVPSISPLIVTCNVDLYASNSSSGSQTASNHWKPNCKSCVNILFLTLLLIQSSQSIVELSKFNWEVGGIDIEVISSRRYVFLGSLELRVAVDGRGDRYPVRICMHLLAIPDTVLATLLMNTARSVVPETTIIIQTVILDRRT